MLTITSPRPSAPSTSISSSPTASRTSSPAPSPRRANRSALRDYYNIKPPNPVSLSTTSNPSSPSSLKISELDASDFDADAYVKSVLANHGLEGVLKVEGGLINEIKGLDGDRKALVYDNYSKLITATDTIRRMRANMDPLTPTTGTLGMAVGYIAETAGGLATATKMQGEEHPSNGDDAGRAKETQERAKRKQTLRWVVGTPKRLELLLERGKKGEAGRDWQEIRQLLVKWEGVDGANELIDQCERTMSRD